MHVLDTQTTVAFQAYAKLPKFKYYTKMMAELKKTLEEEIEPLLSR